MSNSGPQSEPGKSHPMLPRQATVQISESAAETVGNDNSDADWWQAAARELTLTSLSAEHNVDGAVALTGDELTLPEGVWRVRAEVIFGNNDGSNTGHPGLAIVDDVDGGSATLYAEAVQDVVLPAGATPTDPVSRERVVVEATISLTDATDITIRARNDAAAGTLTTRPGSLLVVEKVANEDQIES